MNEAPTKDLTKQHTLPSGAVLHLGRPPYAAAARLRNALAKSAGARPLSPDEMKLGLDMLKENPSAGGALVSRVLSVLGSEEVELAVFECLVQATYQPKGAADSVRLKFTKELLDHADFGDEARADFYPVCLKAGEAAVGPFLGALVSAYMEFLKGRAAPASK